jgi:hypothetical protein
MTKKEITILILILGMVFAGLANSNNNQLTYAHNFTPNSLSTFITLVYRAQVELSLANSSFPLNVTIALDHAEDAAQLIDDAYYFDEEIVDDADFTRKYNEALNSRNSTIHALVIANIVDQILREYGKAFDIGYDLTNMSNMMRADMPDVTSYPAPPSGSSNNTDTSTNSTNQNNELRVVNIADYQSAQKLSEKAYQIFSGNPPLLQLSSNNTDTSIMAGLEKSIKDLSYLVEIKAPAQEIMILVHGEIHPSLQLAYDLILKR